jgi:hypothetical protein
MSRNQPPLWDMGHVRVISAVDALYASHAVQHNLQLFLGHSGGNAGISLHTLLVSATRLSHSELPEVCTSVIIRYSRNTKEHNVSVSGSVSVYRRGGWTPALLGPLEKIQPQSLDSFLLPRQRMDTDAVSGIFCPIKKPPLVSEVSANFADRGCCVVNVTDPYCRILDFLYRSSYFIFQAAPQLYSRGWVDPVPDPLLLRKSGSAGIEPWPLDL